MPEIPWWKKTVVYQIYPRSFQSSRGAGVGDLNGIIARLDYLHDLGIETIWFSPFYPSPTYKHPKDHDCGYDISDYRAINPEYGDMATFERLVAEMHARGMKIVLDMVMNHTSVEHPWFQESRSSRDNPKRDWYIWRDGRSPDGKRPPNNWQSMITGGAWAYDERTGQFYYHAFLECQPDLNYRNPAVQAEMLDTLRFWLDKGVDGFRLDIIHALFEDPLLRDAPFKLTLDPGNGDVGIRDNRYQLHLPDTLAFCERLRATIDEYEGRFMVGEVACEFSKLKQYAGAIKGNASTGLNMVFAFQALSTPLKASRMRALMENLERYFPDPLIPTWVFGNHDQSRRMTKLKGDVAKAKLNAALQLTARGVPYIYYGEEIGMQNSRLPARESQDAVAHHLRWLPQIAHDILRGSPILINRDECRTPMQWDASANAGFCPADVRAWLPVDPRHAQCNVAHQQDDPDSLLHCYKRFLAARRATPALHSGSSQFLALSQEAADVLAYQRTAVEGGLTQEAFVFLNMSERMVAFPNPAPGAAILVSTHRQSATPQETIRLKPWEGLVILRKR